MHVGDLGATNPARHQSTIEALAREMRVEPARVRHLFERELAQLEAQAKVRAYLLVLACRNVRIALLAETSTNR